MGPVCCPLGKRCTLKGNNFSLFFRKSLLSLLGFEQMGPVCCPLGKGCTLKGNNFRVVSFSEGKQKKFNRVGFSEKNIHFP